MEPGEPRGTRVSASERVLGRAKSTLRASRVPESESRLATVPPKVQPFSLRKDLALGERVSVQCTVNGGDTPLLVTWTKDGVAAEQIPGTEVRQLDQYTNILSITRLAALHTGNYTCTAANDAATVTHTAPLRVNGN